MVTERGSFLNGCVSSFLWQSETVPQRDIILVVMSNDDPPNMTLLDRWNHEFFDAGLSSEVLDLLKDLPNQNAEVHAFVERMFRFMKHAKFPAKDFSILMGWAVGFLPSRILPGAWG